MKHDNNEPIINLNQLRFSYASDSERHLLQIPSWQVNNGESVLIIGSSGSGKSTLLNLLSGILTPDSGKIVVTGQALENLTNRQKDHFRATHIGYVTQSFNLIPYLSAIDNIKLTNWHTLKSDVQPQNTKLGN